MFVINLVILVCGTILIVWVSRASLRNPSSHGFYRFFAWETILIMFVLNSKYWFREPFSPRQILSWLLLIISLVLIFQGVQLFRQKGDLDEDRSDPTLVGIEKTTALVTTGLYKYIRHPFYSSLLFLAWGIVFKRIIWYEILLALLTTVLLLMTAKQEESENLEFFGEPYQEYLQSTKMFIPYIL